MASFWKEVRMIVILAIVILTAAGPAPTPSPSTPMPTTTNVTTAPTTGGSTTTSSTTAIRTDASTTTIVTEQLTTEELTTSITSMKMTTDMPDPPGKWNVVDYNGNECMKMEFNGVFTLGQDSQFVISQDANSSASICSGDVAVFNLVQNDEQSLEMNLQFEKAGNTYKLKRFNFTILIDGKPLIADRTYDYFEAPLGSFYFCDDIWIDQLASITFTSTHRKMQPFVQETNEKDYGNKFECGDPLPSFEPKKRVGLIVSMTLLCVLVVAIGIFILLRKRSAYKRFSDI